MTKTPNLPTPEELDAIFEAFGDVDETLSEIIRRVLEATNYKGEQEVTWEHVGSFASFANDLRRFGRGLVETADKVSCAALDDLESILRNGSQGNVPQHDLYGRQNYLENGLMGKHVEETYFPEFAAGQGDNA